MTFKCYLSAVTPWKNLEALARSPQFWRPEARRGPARRLPGGALPPSAPPPPLPPPQSPRFRAHSPQLFLTVLPRCCATTWRRFPARRNAKVGAEAPSGCRANGSSGCSSGRQQQEGQQWGMAAAAAADQRPEPCLSLSPPSPRRSLEPPCRLDGTQTTTAGPRDEGPMRAKVANGGTSSHMGLGGRWGTGSCGPKRQQCWGRTEGRDSKALPKTTEQSYSSEATPTENRKSLDHTLQVEEFLQLT